MKKINFTLASILVAGSLSAQVTIREENFTPTGVSNEGVVAGYYDQASPYFLWNTADNTMKEIGGVSAGFGFGGMAKFSADGKFLSGSMHYDMPISTDWKKTQLSDCDYTITEFGSPVAVSQIFAVGYNDASSSKGVILTSSNDGVSWQLRAKSKEALETICFLNSQVGFIGGSGGYFGLTTSRGNDWSAFDPRPKGSTDIVDTYKAIDFIREEPYYGVVGAELADGKYAVYQSPDGAETWTAATGVTGIPFCITHVNETFFMGTQNGRILKSTDHGLTWTEIFKSGGFLQPIFPIYKIKFADEQTGIAATNMFVYRTTDGGETWNIAKIADDIPQKLNWYDILWTDSKNVMIVGSMGYSYKSSDSGNSWVKVDIESDGKTDMKAISMTDVAINISGVNGNFYHQSKIDKKNTGYMARYNVEAEEWTPLGSLGFYDSSSAGSGYDISGDGKTIVGLSKICQTTTSATGSYAHASAWSEDNGFIDLGSLYDNLGRSTRANVVNYDGSVIAGWQDQRGPWKSAVWRRNAQGGYDPNEYILIDPSEDAKNEANRIGECRAISQDGTWIGGSGSSMASGPLSIISEDQKIANQPWIWSEKTGLKRLGMISELANETVQVGHVSGINNDGTVAVGFIVFNNYMYGFIWTLEGGMKSLNEYVTNTMKYDLGNNHLASVLSMSPNGRYITGWGINDNSTIMAYQIDLLYTGTGIHNPGQAESIVTVYPNPVSDVLHVDLPFEGNAQIRLTDIQGRIVMSQNTACAQNTLVVNDILPGIYFLEVTAEGLHKTYKVKITD